eukprot:SAG22_NODE_5283_length_1046_cov_1.506864_3_plen_42_part_01
MICIPCPDAMACRFWEELAGTLAGTVSTWTKNFTHQYHDSTI